MGRRKSSNIPAAKLSHTNDICEYSNSIPAANLWHTNDICEYFWSQFPPQSYQPLITNLLILSSVLKPVELTHQLTTSPLVKTLTASPKIYWTDGLKHQRSWIKLKSHSFLFSSLVLPEDCSSYMSSSSSPASSPTPSPTSWSSAFSLVIFSKSSISTKHSVAFSRASGTYSTCYKKKKYKIKKRCTCAR